MLRLFATVVADVREYDSRLNKVDERAKFVETRMFRIRKTVLYEFTALPSRRGSSRLRVCRKRPTRRSKRDDGVETFLVILENRRHLHETRRTHGNDV